MVRVQHIPTSEMHRYWPIAEPFIAKAAKRYKDQYSLDDVKAAVFDGDAALWLIMVGSVFSAAMTTSELIYPKKRYMLVELLGGNNAKMWYNEATKQMADIARDAGYDAIMSQARSGWSRMAEKSGFKRLAVVYEMGL